MTEATENYICTDCGAGGVKLWRQSHTFANHIQLLCGPCALKNQDKKGPIDSDGFRETQYGRSDQIGWLVPAVPVGETFWGYSSVPPEGVRWWQALPLKPMTRKVEL